MICGALLRDENMNIHLHCMTIYQCKSSKAGSVSTAQNLNRPSHIEIFNYSAIVKSKKVARFFAVHGLCHFGDSVAVASMG